MERSDDEMFADRYQPKANRNVSFGQGVRVMMLKVRADDGKSEQLDNDVDTGIVTSDQNFLSTVSSTNQYKT